MTFSPKQTNIILSFFIGLIFFLLVIPFFSPSPTLAAAATGGSSAASGITAPSADTWDANNQTNFFGLTGIFSSVCFLSAWSIYAGEKCGGINGQGKLSMYNGLPSGSAIGMTGSMIGMIYDNRPVSSQEYLAHIGENLGIVPKSAYAEVGGSGASIIKPVETLWQLSRNIAYGFFIFVIISTGFMIMFRHKINPQTVVTIQSALPNIVIGLILVTFSYLIAAFIVDLTFVGIQLVTQLFGSAGNNLFGDAGGLQNLAKTGNFLQMYGTSALNGDAWGKISQGTSSQIYQSFGDSGAPLATAGVGAIIGGMIGFLPGALIGSLIGGALGPDVIVPGLVIAILLIALFVQFFKLAFALIGAYIQILVLTVAGPFYILWGSLPGKSGTINTWIRGLLANVLIFPAVFGGFLFAGLILGFTGGFDTTLPLFGGMSGSFIQVLIAYGILLGLPAIPNMVKSALKYQGPQGFQQAAIGGFMGGFGYGQSTAGQGYQRLWRGPTRAEEVAQGPLARGFRRVAGRAAVPWGERRTY